MGFERGPAKEGIGLEHTGDHHEEIDFQEKSKFISMKSKNWFPLKVKIDFHKNLRLNSIKSKNLFSWKVKIDQWSPYISVSGEVGQFGGRETTQGIISQV